MGVAPTATWLMRPVGSLDLPAMVGTVGIAPTPSRLQRVVQTIYTTFPKKWQALRDSHPPGRFWRPTRPLEHLGPMVPEAVARRLPSRSRGTMPSLKHLSGENGLPSVASFVGRTKALRRQAYGGHHSPPLRWGEGWWSRTVTLRLLRPAPAGQVRRAAIGTTAPKWTRRRDSHPRTSALQAGPLATRARREK